MCKLKSYVKNWTNIENFLKKIPNVNAEYFVIQNKKKLCNQ